MDSRELPRTAGLTKSCYWPLTNLSSLYTIQRTQLFCCKVVFLQGCLQIAFKALQKAETSFEVLCRRVPHDHLRACKDTMDFPPAAVSLTVRSLWHSRKEESLFDHWWQSKRVTAAPYHTSHAINLDWTTQWIPWAPALPKHIPPPPSWGGISAYDRASESSLQALLAVGTHAQVRTCSPAVSWQSVICKAPLLPHPWTFR